MLRQQLLAWLHLDGFILDKNHAVTLASPVVQEQLAEAQLKAGNLSGALPGKTVLQSFHDKWR